MKLIRKNRLKDYFCQLAFAAFFVLGANVVSAIPLGKYRQNVGEAKAALEELQEVYYLEDEPAEFAQEVKKIQKLIPATQTVEAADKTPVETDNGWLETELKAVDATDSVDDKLIKLNHIAERLGAIESRLAELENATAAASAKNDDKQILNEILRRAEYQKAAAEKEKSVLQQIIDGVGKWFEDFFRWLFGNRAPVEDQQTPANLPAIGGFLQYVVIALAVAVIGFVLWRFVLPLFGGERPRKRSKRAEPRVILGETLAADETAANLLLEAERLAVSGDVRAAIRKGYIATLCELNDRKLIGLARHKTNRDYLRDIERKRHTIFQPLRLLTNSFEQHWYGEVPASEQDWQEFRGQYAEIVSSEQ